MWTCWGFPLSWTLNSVWRQTGLAGCQGMFDWLTLKKNSRVPLFRVATRLHNRHSSMSELESHHNPNILKHQTVLWDGGNSLHWDFWCQWHNGWKAHNKFLVRVAQYHVLLSSSFKCERYPKEKEPHISPQTIISVLVLCPRSHFIEASPTLLGGVCGLCFRGEWNASATPFLHINTEKT